MEGRVVCIRTVHGAITQDNEYYIQQHPTIDCYYSFKDNRNSFRTVTKGDADKYFKELKEN